MDSLARGCSFEKIKDKLVFPGSVKVIISTFALRNEKTSPT